MMGTIKGGIGRRGGTRILKKEWKEDKSRMNNKSKSEKKVRRRENGWNRA